MLKVTITKQTADMSLGFRLGRNGEGKIFFAKINPGSVLDGTVVREGMLVCLVNGIDCTGQSLKFVTSIIRDTEGALQLGVRDPSNVKCGKTVLDWDDQTATSSCTRAIDDDETSTLVCVSKLKRLDESIGLRLRVSAHDKAIKIDRILPEGIFGETALRSGMILLRVNGVLVKDFPVSDVLDLIRFTDGMLTLEAEKIGKNPTKFSVCMQKVGTMGKLVTSQVAKMNSKQWGVVLRTGFVVLLEMNGIDSGFVTGD